MFSTMECQRRAAAIQTSSQLSPFTRVTLSNFFLIVISRIADGPAHLSPLGVCSDIERDPGAGGSVGQPGAAPQRLHLQEWSRLDILKIPLNSEVNLSLKCPNFYLPSFVPPNPAPPFLPIVKCQITNLEQILHKKKARTQKGQKEFQV